MSLGNPAVVDLAFGKAHTAGSSSQDLRAAQGYWERSSRVRGFRKSIHPFIHSIADVLMKSESGAVGNGRFTSDRSVPRVETTDE